jgi:DNA-binding MarR family transcriptional regulator
MHFPRTAPADTEILPPGAAGPAARSRGHGGRSRMNELAYEVALSGTGRVRLVDGIDAAGLLRREPVPEDGRGS